MCKIKCSQYNCEFNQDKMCTTDIEVYEGGCATYKEKESSKRSKFTYKQMSTQDLGDFIYVIKHSLYISVDTIVDLIVKDSNELPKKIVVDISYSNGLKNSDRFLYLELVSDSTKKLSYDISVSKWLEDTKSKIILGVETKRFFLENQDLIDGSIWCNSEKENMKKTAFQLIEEQNK